MHNNYDAYFSETSALLVLSLLVRFSEQIWNFLVTRALCTVALSESAHRGD